MPDFLRKHRLIPRLVMIWGPVIITIVLLRVTEPDAIQAIGGAGMATIVTGTIGILATAIALYLNKPGDQ
ncbi:hypothetical protein NLU14_08640 [Marinobacter sp. 71-i]|uniref:Holin n=1 Tax=Marinobacter iranensis TaxID=2962607 RepID=A0ABT5Y9Q9_9GAMM|nr:hypothetical protein [Marinobacter iranensis]MDF0750296.1 hypothetical protein [Marinobacter iranensis]